MIGKNVQGEGKGNRPGRVVDSNTVFLVGGKVFDRKTPETAENRWNFLK